MSEYQNKYEENDFLASFSQNQGLNVSIDVNVEEYESCTCSSSRENGRKTRRYIAKIGYQYYKKL